ncbi:hypothetical protein Salat_0035300 [Sesamum alatum]|uniref:Uncharacterized protein n=1 Tax=Sesamum alatum TaxID=300844 RepID=A0AAE2CWU5_9LAMI|nr:hypothetical protein Salat_0035300 [Sesamum alatum]
MNNKAEESNTTSPSKTYFADVPPHKNVVSPASPTFHQKHHQLGSNNGHHRSGRDRDRVVTTLPTAISSAASITSLAPSIATVERDATAVELLIVHHLDHVHHRLIILKSQESEATGSSSLTIVDSRIWRDDQFENRCFWCGGES